MANQMKSEIKKNEIEFMKQMELHILPNRNKVDRGTLKNVGALVGIMVNTTCPSCAAKGGSDMLNYYNALKPVWDQYNKPIEIPVELYTKFEETILEEPKIEPKKVPVKKIVKKI